MEDNRTTDELLNAVENGNELYNKSSHFRNAINAINRGIDPVILLAQACAQLMQTINEFSEHVMKEPVSDAIDFVEYLQQKGYMKSSEIDDEGKYTIDWKTFKTIEDVYQEFKQQKNK